MPQDTMSDQTPIEAAARLSPPGLPWRADVISKLEELVRLEAGWDGYRGRPVPLDIAIFALRLLEATCTPRTPDPQLVPGGGGEVQIEWHEQETDIELYIRGPYDVQAWRAVANGASSEETELDLTDDFTLVAAWLAELTERAIAAGSAAA